MQTANLASTRLQGVLNKQVFRQTLSLQVVTVKKLIVPLLPVYTINNISKLTLAQCERAMSKSPRYNSSKKYANHVCNPVMQRVCV